MWAVEAECLTQNPSFISSQLSELGPRIPSFIFSVFSLIKQKERKKETLPHRIVPVTITIIANIYRGSTMYLAEV